MTAAGGQPGPSARPSGRFSAAVLEVVSLYDGWRIAIFFFRAGEVMASGDDPGAQDRYYGAKFRHYGRIAQSLSMARTSKIPYALFFYPRF